MPFPALRQPSQALRRALLKAFSLFAGHFFLLLPHCHEIRQDGTSNRSAVAPMQERDANMSQSRSPRNEPAVALGASARRSFFFPPQEKEGFDFGIQRRASDERARESTEMKRTAVHHDP